PKKSNPDFSGDFLSDCRSKTGASAFPGDEEGTEDPASAARKLPAVPAESKFLERKGTGRKSGNSRKHILEGNEKAFKMKAFPTKS
ncbi:hypothetical protein WKH31_18150, partial [Metabacillus indicus]|uniref:hypothetical protein n=1 Tax=Metabacillus indicus TaxID=246786 RepID=UPI00317666A2